MRLVIGLVAIAACVAGCGGPDDGRVEVAGTVKLKGKPIRDGAAVSFSALENQGTEANVPLSSGAFTLPRANGLKPGRYLVRVTLGDGRTAVNPTDSGAPPGPGGGTNVISKELVPADWNRNSKQQVTVTKDGPNTFDFDIP